MDRRRINELDVLLLLVLLAALVVCGARVTRAPVSELSPDGAFYVVQKER